MEKHEVEALIGEHLQIIRQAVMEYYPKLDICSMYVSPHSTAMWVMDKNKNYILQHDWRKEEEE